MTTLEEVRSRARPVLADAPVVFAYLFGSTATGRAGPASDVDIAVYLDDALPGDDRQRLVLRLGTALEQALRADVDLVSLNDAPLRLVGRVLAERQVVYSADETARVRYETSLRPQVFDFEHHARQLDRAFLAAHAQGRR